MALPGPRRRFNMDGHEIHSSFPHPALPARAARDRLRPDRERARRRSGGGGQGRSLLRSPRHRLARPGARLLPERLQLDRTAAGRLDPGGAPRGGRNARTLQSLRRDGDAARRTGAGIETAPSRSDAGRRQGPQARRRRLARTDRAGRLPGPELRHPALRLRQAQRHRRLPHRSDRRPTFRRHPRGRDQIPLDHERRAARTRTGGRTALRRPLRTLRPPRPDFRTRWGRPPPDRPRLRRRKARRPGLAARRRRRGDRRGQLPAAGVRGLQRSRLLSRRTRRRRCARSRLRQRRRGPTRGGGDRVRRAARREAVGGWRRLERGEGRQGSPRKRPLPRPLRGRRST